MLSSFDFTTHLLKWFDQHGRKELPWQQAITPYRVWVSEIMLQQTQVATVIDYFNRFMLAFPTVETLAHADEDAVLHVWTGLGYYSRARNLHKAAQKIVSELNGQFPKSVEALITLPGIGKSTAGAIAAIAMQIPAPILDGNVKRVLTRFHAIAGWTGKRDIEKELWALAERYTSPSRPADYAQGIMDLGALLCTPKAPQCTACPLQTACLAYTNNQQNLYPSPKPKKALPSKTTFMLLLENNQGHILLEKRPPTGIWGGLWSLPEYPALLELKREWRPHAAHIQALDTFKHTFSHYHLHITPIHLHTTALRAQPLMETADRIWYNIHDPDPRGLPAPVKKLLQQLTQQPEDTP